MSSSLRFIELNPNAELAWYKHKFYFTHPIILGSVNPVLQIKSE